MDEAVLHCDDSARVADCIPAYHKFDEVPFDFQRRRMSVALGVCGRADPDLQRCRPRDAGGISQLRIAGVTIELGDAHRHQAQTTVDALSEDGFRVIAVACRTLPAIQSSCSVRDERNLILLGFVAFLDPPKDGAIQALAALAAHGLSVKVLTGDNDVVARRICKAVVCQWEHTVLGPQLEGMSPEQLGAACQQSQLFARLSPLQKAIIVETLQRQGACGRVSWRRHQ